MKTSNLLLTVAVVVTLVVQALLVFGYKSAYLEQLTAKQEKAHTIFRTFDKEKASAKVLRVKGIRFTLHLGAEKAGFRHDYRRVGFGYSKRGDTLEISAVTGRQDDVDFCELYFSEMPAIELYDSNVSIVTVKPMQASLLVKKNSVCALQKGTWEKLDARVEDISKLRLAEGSEINQLTVSLADKAGLEDVGATVKKIRLASQSDSSEVKLSGKSLKNLQ
ncbi:MAG TPA: hypothetical protein DCM71_01435 [Runella sp.]|nr:hypothetical protein [Runella sp.]